MAIVLVSGNLNEWGDQGRYEADPSTWGFDSAPYGAYQARNNTYSYAGLYSKLVQTYLGFSLGQMIIDAGRYTGVIGKTYLARVRVRTTTLQPIASDSCLYSFENPIIPFLDSETTRTILSAKDTWVEVEAKWTHSIITGDIFLKVLQNGGGNSINISGVTYIDSFEIYEYIDTGAEPPPAPEEADLVWFSKNFITQAKAASVGWGALNNYRLYTDVRVEDVPDSGVFTSKLTLALYPAADGNVLFQVRQAFRNLMEPVAPAFNTSGIERLTDRIRLFKHFTGEMDDLEEVPAALTEGAAQLVLWGGLDKFNYPTLNYFATYATHKKFMTWAPVVKQVDPNQEDYLNFWLWKEGVSVIHVRCKAYYDDDTNTTATVATMATPVYTRLYQIAAGPANSGAKLINPAKTIIKYELWLEDSTVAISETRTFVLDEFSYPDVKLFMFLNSLGSFEVLRFVGAWAVSSQFAREVATKYLAPGYSAMDGEKIMNNATRTQKEEYSSGFFTGELADAWLLYMNDFLSSKKVYDVTGGTRRPVVITDGGTVKDSKDFKKYFRFVCEDAYDNTQYTP